MKRFHAHAKSGHGPTAQVLSVLLCLCLLLTLTPTALADNQQITEQTSWQTDGTGDNNSTDPTDIPTYPAVEDADAPSETQAEQTPQKCSGGPPGRRPTQTTPSA
jgi:hypothetical protein